jgi:hypothetical protein
MNVVHTSFMNLVQAVSRKGQSDGREKGEPPSRKGLVENGPSTSAFAHSGFKWREQLAMISPGSFDHEQRGKADKQQRQAKGSLEGDRD